MRFQNRGKDYMKNTEHNKTTIILLSGGIDSATLLAKLSSEIINLLQGKQITNHCT